MIKAIEIQNFKILESFSLELNPHLNVFVGNNEAGKSTLLEAVSLALTKRLNGRLIDGDISPYLFNKQAVDNYLAGLQAGGTPPLPSIIIELYLDDGCDLNNLRGSNNLRRENCIGVRLEVAFNEEYAPEYAQLLENDRDSIKLVPAEYYIARWSGFSGNAVSARSLNLGVSYIDATTIRLQSGTDFYLRDIVQGSLEQKEQVALSLAYRGLKEKFTQEAPIAEINKKLAENKGAISAKDLTISIDLSQKSGWETNLVPHLDDIPFQHIGKGEQSVLKIMLALERRGEDHIVLLEEPENHLSFSAMRVLIERIKEKCEGKQLLIATHSAYVINKLGLESLILLNGCVSAKLSDLSDDTQNYFMKLSGYDTLRLVLAQKAILVEGPSDELIVQKAYHRRHERFPIDDGIDVINVKGLAFKRFLDIAKLLEREVAVVTDNDGDYQKKVEDKYAEYAGYRFISVHADRDNECKTLEPQIAKVNELDLMNRVFGTTCGTFDELTAHMQANKTECALKIFESGEAVNFPSYINDAVA